MEMKHLPMTRRKDPVSPPGSSRERSGDGHAGGAFDVWLQRGLHQLFDGVAREPIPDELLRLIEDDRSASEAKDKPAVPRAPRKQQ